MGGSTYSAFVEQELKAERDRRALLDSRGQAVVTTSGSLVTLLVALGAFISSQPEFKLPTVAIYPLIATVSMFTIAAFLGLLATYNFAYAVANRDTLSALPCHWRDSEVRAGRNVLAANIGTVVTLRKGNNKKATLLLVSLFAQLAALISLGATVYLTIIKA